MSVTIGDAILYLRSNNDQLDAGLKKAHSETEGMFGKLGKVIGGGLAIGAAAGVAGLVGLGAALVDCTKGAMEAETIQAALNAVLTSTKGAAGMTAESVNALATSLQNVTTYEDDAIVQGENLLLTFTGIGKDVFPQATEAMLDMSTALGQDMKSSAIQLGKALNDPIAGATALRKVGVALTDAQEAQIKAFVASGDVMSAQKVILKELATEFGGAAKAAGQTMAGQMAILQNKIGAVKDTIGAALLPVLTRLATMLNDVFSKPEVQKAIASIAKGIGDIAENAASLLGSLASGDTGGIIAALGISPDAIKVVQGIFDEIRSAWQAFVEAVTPIIETIKETITSVFNSPELKEAVRAVQSVFGEMGKSGGGFAAWVKANLPAISKIIQNVVVTMGQFVTKILLPAYTAYYTFIATNWPKVEKIITTVFKVVQTVVTAVIKAVMPFITKESGKVVSWVKENWPLIQKTITTVMKAIQDVVETVLKLIKGFWDTFGKQIMVIVENNWKTIKIIIGTAMDVIMGIIKTVMQIINGDWAGAWETIKQTIAKVWEGIKALVANALDTLNRAIIQPLMGAIATWLSNKWNEIKATIQAVWNAIIVIIKTAWESIQSTIQTILNVIAAFIATQFNAIKNTIQTIWNAITALTQAAWALIQSIISAILNAIVSYITTQFNLIKTIIDNVWNAISTLTQSAWNTIHSIISAVVGAIVSYITTQFNLIQTIINNVWNTIASITQAAWNAVYNIISAVLSAIISLISNQFNGIVAAIQTAWNAVNAITSLAWLAIQATIDSVLNAIVSFIVAQFDSIQTTISNAWQAVNDFTSSWWNTITNTISSMVNAIWNGITSQFNGIRDTISNVWTSVNDAAYWAWDTIKNTIDNVVSGWDGITSIFDTLRNAAEDVWSGLTDFVDGVWNGITTNVRNGVNSVIDVLNGLIHAYNVFLEAIGQDPIPDIPYAAHGLDMVVPPGFPNDTFPIMASSGEHVKITPVERINTSGLESLNKSTPITLPSQPAAASVTIYGGLSLYGVQDAQGLLSQLAALQAS